jgi:hypothetical protein
MGVGGYPTPRPLYSRERDLAPIVSRQGGPSRACLDGCGKSRPTGIPSPDRPARSESLYRLSYRGPRARVFDPFNNNNIFIIIINLCEFKTRHTGCNVEGIPARVYLHWRHVCNNRRVAVSTCCPYRQVSHDFVIQNYTDIFTNLNKFDRLLGKSWGATFLCIWGVWADMTLLTAYRRKLWVRDSCVAGRMVLRSSGT